MALINPGCDTKHIIQQAMNCKTLAALAKEEDAFQEKKAAKITKAAHEMQHKKPVTVCTKSDLEALKQKCRNKTPDEIFSILGIDVKYNEDGSKSISRYGWTPTAYNFKSAGIDEEELLSGVTEIKGNCNLMGSELTSLGSVKKIGGSLNIPLFTKVQDLSGVKSIGGNVTCYAENPEDSIALLKRIKLNPDCVGGYINPMDTFRLYMLKHSDQIHTSSEAISETPAKTEQATGV